MPFSYGHLISNHRKKILDFVEFYHQYSEGTKNNFQTSINYDSFKMGRKYDHISFVIFLLVLVSSPCGLRLGGGGSPLEDFSKGSAVTLRSAPQPSCLFTQVGQSHGSSRKLYRLGNAASIARVFLSLLGMKQESGRRWAEFISRAAQRNQR